LRPLLQGVVRWQWPQPLASTATRQKRRRRPPEGAFSRSRWLRCPCLTGGRMPAQVRLASEIG